MRTGGSNLQCNYSALHYWYGGLHSENGKDSRPSGQARKGDGRKGRNYSARGKN